MAIYPLLRPLLFALEAERAHQLVLHGIAGAARVPGFLTLLRTVYGFQHPALRVRLWEREFPNPVGLAAGFDKDGLLIAPLLGLGFGFVEAGTVTPRGQPGNPRPRLFRLPAHKALINRMGFNNLGALHMAGQLGHRRLAGTVGVNIGKNFDTPLDEAITDYLTCLHAVYSVADYIVINLSSPNTPGLRALQEKPALKTITEIIFRERIKLQEVTGRWLPFLIKIAPDMSEGELADVVEVALESGTDGLIATNTTLRREGSSGKHKDEQGGLSGRPLHGEALRTVAALHRLSGGKLPLVGVGGVASATDAYAFILAGASLVQLYSALVYRGPGLVRSIKKGLVQLLERDGFSNVSAAVGSAPPKA
ncbi:MAG: quinone-dependent dihydroorotate dehydrogenase [SAR324 cluster bacterium]|nr:quinone-dependent dihydroorotate dehydrogenase [SAR324 cluster bacterium]